MALALSYYTGYKLDNKNFRGAGIKIYYSTNDENNKLKL